MSTRHDRDYPLLAAFACHQYRCPEEWTWLYLLRWAMAGGKPGHVPTHFYGHSLYEIH